MRSITDRCACGCGGEANPGRRFILGHSNNLRKNTIENILRQLIPQANGCLLWPGRKTHKGYGEVRYQGRMQSVHKILYEHFVGPVPDGHDLHHFFCRQKDCANFHHLEPLPHREHSSMGAMAQRHRAKTHCPQGHPYSGDNVHVMSNGGRLCKRCSIQRQVARRARQKAEEGR